MKSLSEQRPMLSSNNSVVSYGSLQEEHEASKNQQRNPFLLLAFGLLVTVGCAAGGIVHKQMRFGIQAQVTLATQSTSKNEVLLGPQSPNLVLKNDATIAKNCGGIGRTAITKIGMNGGSATWERISVYRPGLFEIEFEYWISADALVTITLNGVISEHTFPSQGTQTCDKGTPPSKTSIQAHLLIQNTLQVGMKVSGEGPQIASVRLKNMYLVGSVVEAESGILSPTGAQVSQCGCQCSSNKLVKLTMNGAVTLSVIPKFSGIHKMQVAYFSSATPNGFDLSVTTNNGSPTKVNLYSAGTSCTQGSQVSAETYTINVNLRGNEVNSINLKLSSDDAVFLDYVKITERNPKKGFIWGPYSNVLAARHMEGYVSWYYRYRAEEIDEMRTWARKNDVEFVPMLNTGWNDPSGKTCAFKKILQKQVKPDRNCTLESLKARLDKLDKNRTFYVLGYNEPYPKDDMSHYWKPADAALIWGRYVQPAARHAGLRLVSPTTTFNENELLWTVQFVQACCSRNDCDPELIGTLSVHNYKCKDNFWKNKMRLDGPTSAKSNWKIVMKKLFAENGACSRVQGSWDEWVDTREIWVTETNCYWEDSTAHPNNEGQCRRITRTMTEKKWKWELGTIQMFDRQPEIVRYAWWCLMNTRPEKQPTVLVDATYKLTPAGRGYLNPFSATNCTAKS